MQKITEWRPPECGTRIGDVMLDASRYFLSVKCRRCSKREGKDVFHDIEVTASEFIRSTNTDK